MWWLEDPDPKKAAGIAFAALEACGATLTREQFSIYAWTHAKLEAAAWDAYCRIVNKPN